MINKINIHNRKLMYPGNLLGWMISLLMLLFIGSQQACTQQTKYLEELSISIPIDANCWIVNRPEAIREVFKENMISNWTSADDTIHLYFHTASTGEFHLGFVGESMEGSSKFSFSHEGKNRIVTLESDKSDTVYVGKFKIITPGYQTIQLCGLEKDGANFGTIKEFLVGGEAVEQKISFVRDDFYWGKRGPSVHLSYTVPEEAGEVKWFYNEITVPQGNDVLGSYFMANGFGEGYFGIQVNSETERRILFSVWSPYRTDNPNEIPKDMRIRMLAKGEDVHTGKFGNEGSGGQSYLRYPWKAGSTYGFLLRGEPQGDNSTIYTAWFYPPEKGTWQLIASFQRPQTDTHLRRLHSFLENFHTGTGFILRSANYSNQWICNTEGEWFELTNATFTADATARKEARLDYSGGSEGDRFFLKNCGFTNDHTDIGTKFDRKPGANQPQIDLGSLPY